MIAVRINIAGARFVRSEHPGNRNTLDVAAGNIVSWSLDADTLDNALRLGVIGDKGVYPAQDYSPGRFYGFTLRCLVST